MPAIERLHVINYLLEKVDELLKECQDITEIGLDNPKLESWLNTHFTFSREEVVNALRACKKAKGELNGNG